MSEAFLFAFYFTCAYLCIMASAIFVMLCYIAALKEKP